MCLRVFFVVFFLFFVDQVFSKTPSAELESSENVFVFDSNVTLINDQNSQNNGFILRFKNSATLTCDDVSIVVVEPVGLIAKDSVFFPASVNNPMPQYTCVKKDSFLELSSAPPLYDGFRPWADTFEVILGTQKFFFTVQTTFKIQQTLQRGAQSVMRLDQRFEGCGLRGTILQRVYDCSKKITNYAISVDTKDVTPNKNVSNPDLFWFVVACPSGETGFVSQQTCAWLTPVVNIDNPAFDTIATELGFPTFQYSMMRAYQPRLLFGGKLNNDGQGYGFIQANGFLYSTEPEVYLPHYGFVYKTTNEVYLANDSNPGTSPSHTQPVHTAPSVCVAEAGQSLQKYEHYKTFGTGQFPESDAKIRDIVSHHTGASIEWRMPSYPMYNLLSGGTPSNPFAQPACEQSQSVYSDNFILNLLNTNSLGRPYCNMSNSGTQQNFGFAAINVPGFAMTDVTPQFEPFLEELWSSSSLGDKYAWAFVPLSQNARAGFVTGEVHFYPLAVRCVSLIWH